MRGLVQVTQAFRRSVNANINVATQAVTKRGMAGHGVNIWEAPLEPAKWKPEHLVLAVLGGWGIVIYSATKYFGGGKKKEDAPTPAKGH